MSHHRALGNIRATDDVAEIVEDLRDATHARATDANEVDIFDTPHKMSGTDSHVVAPARIPWANCWVASVRDCDRALTDMVISSSRFCWK